VAGWLRNCSSIPGKGKTFSLLHGTQIDSGAHERIPAAPSLGVKWAERKANHSPSSSTNVKISFSYNLFSHASWDHRVYLSTEKTLRLLPQKACTATALLATYFTLVSCLAYSSTLKMEATCSFETSVDFLRATRRYIPEGRTLQELLKSNLRRCINYRG
jgi:hypothetical protein